MAAAESAWRFSDLAGEGNKQAAVLNSGASMPLVGLGTWKAKPGEVGAAVKAALAAGYRHIDCAAVYGNEKEVGEVFKSVFRAADGSDELCIPREEVFITSKLWNSEHGAGLPLPALKNTLQDLGLDYLDLYLIHWPQAFEKVEGRFWSFPKNEDGTVKYDLKSPLTQVWKEMEALVDAGLSKHIGLSNFNSTQIDEIVAAARIKPAVLQIESHPLFPNTKLIAHAKKHGIVSTAYSPLGSGAADKDGRSIPTHPKLAEIGKERLGGKTAAQVAIAFQRARGVTVIPKSVNEARIKQNLNVFFEMGKEDCALVEALDEGKRMGWGGPLLPEGAADAKPRDIAHRDYPFVFPHDPEKF